MILGCSQSQLQVERLLEAVLLEEATLFRTGCKMPLEAGRQLSLIEPWHQLRFDLYIPDDQQTRLHNLQQVLLLQDLKAVQHGVSLVILTYLFFQKPLKFASSKKQYFHKSHQQHQLNFLHALLVKPRCIYNLCKHLLYQ